MELSLKNGQNVWFGVVSSNRPESVKPMQELVEAASWYVPPSQVSFYKRAGAFRVVGTSDVMPNIVAGRNQILEEAFSRSLVAVQSDDDFVSSKYMLNVDQKGHYGVPIPFKDAVFAVVSRLLDSPFCLAGVSASGNPYYTTKSKKRVSCHVFIVASLMAIKPNPLRFDPLIVLKEDYDFTVQHLYRFGGVVRCEDVLLTYKHYSNPGGCNYHRTPELERRVIGILRSKWGSLIKPHPRRGSTEILLDLRMFK